MASFDGRPGNFPITAYYKGTFALQFAFTSGGSAYSLAGASATFTIYEKNGTAALSLSSGSGLTITGALGTVDVAITNAQIVALSTQEYNYELILTLSGGDVWPVLDGVFIVSEDGQYNYSGDTITVPLDGNTVSLSIVPGAGSAKTGGVLLSPTSGNPIAAGDSKAMIRINEQLSGLVLKTVGACCSTAGSSGATTVQIRRVRSGVSADMLSTPITIDANETDTATAATAAVINTSYDDVLTGDQIHFDVDSVSDGTLGIYVSFTFSN